VGYLFQICLRTVLFYDPFLSTTYLTQTRIDHFLFSNNNNQIVPFITLQLSHTFSSELIHQACKSIQPSYYRLARTHSDFVFIDVPVTEKNADLHQGLGVPSLPFGHIYHPDKGLVEELKMSKKFFAGFEDALTSYAKDECNVSHRDDHMREKTSKLIDN